MIASCLFLTSTTTSPSIYQRAKTNTHSFSQSTSQMPALMKPVHTGEVHRRNDVIKFGLRYLFSNGANRVLYDTCELVWDTADLLAKPVTGENQMAVFGIRGIVERTAAVQFRFQFRYMIEHLEQTCYWLSVSVHGPMDGCSRDIGINLFQETPDGKPSNQEYFEDAIQNLTNSVRLLGVDSAIRLFMMSWKSIDDNLD